MYYSKNSNYSKYRAIKTTIDGITFDSRKEAKRWQELRLLEKAKKIIKLERQVPYVLIPKSKYGREIKYICDFKYQEICDKYVNEEGENYAYAKEVVEDVKGVKTPVYNLKKRLMAEKYGIEIREV